MEKCINCNKEYTQRGIKIHRKKCDEVYLTIKKKEEERAEKEAKKIKIEFIYKKNLTIGNYLPDDCVKIIYEYLLLQDLNTSYFQLYENICNVSLVCKNFYLNRPVTLQKSMKIKVRNEIDDTICRSWCIDMYGLTNTELDTLDYKIARRSLGGCYHLFSIIEIKDLVFKKYGTEYDYQKYLIAKKNMKLLTKKEKDEIYKKRRKEYDQLFKKYDYLNHIHLQEVYENHNEYIKKGVPKILYVEDQIKKNIHKMKLKNDLKNRLQQENIEYYETSEVYAYINNHIKYNIDYALESLYKRKIKEEIYQKLNKPDYNTIAYIFINNSEKKIEELIDIIKEVDLIQKYMNNNLKVSMDETAISNTIDKWCNQNKNRKLEEFKFIEELNVENQKKIKDYFLIYQNKKILRDKIINHIKNGEKCNDNLLCDYDCNNVASLMCIDYLCKKCCKNNDCKRHYKGN